MYLGRCRCEQRSEKQDLKSVYFISMSPKVHHKSAFRCIILHKNKKCKKL
jgi:hypothetical protein